MLSIGRDNCCRPVSYPLEESMFIVADASLRAMKTRSGYPTAEDLRSSGATAAAARFYQRLQSPRRNRCVVGRDRSQRAEILIHLCGRHRAGEASCPFSANGAISWKPRASPQAFESPCKRSAQGALQLGASIKRVLALNRAFSAGAFELHHQSWGVAPGCP